jgi:voltage-gated potassium channel Kch
VISACRKGDIIEVRQQEGEVTTTRRLHLDEMPWQGKGTVSASIWYKRFGIPRLFLDKLSLLVATGLMLVVLIATAYFHTKLLLSWQDALYFVITTLTTTGYGDYSLKEASFAAKLAGMLVMLSGASLFAILFALVTDWIFRARLDFMMGRRKVGLVGHLIVCGVGDVGVRVVENLLLAGAKVVVIERDPDHRFNHRIRDLGASLILADATLEETLIMSGVKQARAIICATDSDMHNLEIGLNARALQPDIRTVLRVYDRSFAELIQQNFSFDSALSSSAIAAPAFVEAAVSGLAEGGLPCPR